MNLRARPGRLSVSLLVGLTSIGAAHAETVRLVYQAPEGCPLQSDFMTQVQARTVNASFSFDSSPPRLFTVMMSRRDNLYVGTLRIEEPNTPIGEREFSDNDCSEVVSALALLTAIAIDPNASSGPVPSPASSDVRVPKPIPETPTFAPPPAPRTNSASTPWQAAAGVRIFGTGWVTPGLLPGAELFGELWQQKPGLLVFDARLGAAYSTAESQSARWSWYIAKLDVCPIQVPIQSQLMTRSCLSAEAGSMDAQGVDISIPRSRTNPWLAVGASERLVWNVGPLFLDFAAGIAVPAKRYRFGFSNPWVEFHRIPAVGATLVFGAGMRFL